MPRTLLIFGLIAFATFSNAQIDRISIFLDCANTRCDRQFIRTELPIVDYSLDRIEADIHVLLTSQRTGGGGRGYQIILYGQNKFTGSADTLNFSIDQLATDVERRNAILKHLKLGLIPFLLQNNQQDLIEISINTDETNTQSATTIDPWNYWVFRLGGNGSINLDQNYERLRLGANIRATQVTEEKKIWFSVWGNDNKQTFKYEEDSVEEVTIVNNHNIGFHHFQVWSLNKKWAYGYNMGYSSSTFDNYLHQYYFSPSIEYNFFPYSEVNNKLLTMRYGIAIGRNEYRETTIYDKDGETLGAQYLSLAAEFNQKFGSIEIGTKYQHFLHDFALNNLSFDAEIEVRLTGNLSFEVYLFGALVHDQIYLAKGDATQEEVLTRVRQLESSFEFNTWFGINYRFGSNLNNFVNPRFGSRGL